MTLYQRFLSRVLVAVMMVTTVFTALLPSVARAASVFSSTVSTGTVGTAITPTLAYTIDTSAETWADGDTLVFTLPANFPVWSSTTYTVEYDTDTTNNATGETAIVAGAGNGEYAVSNRILTVKWNLSGWGAVVNGSSTVRVIVTAGMVPQYMGASSNITLTGTTANGADANPSTNVSINVSPAAASATVALGNNAVVGVAGNLVATFTTVIDLETGSTVTLVLPGNVDVSQAAYGSMTFTGTAFSSCTGSGQTITCTAGGAVTAGTGTLTITGVKSWYAASSLTTTVTVLTPSSAAQSYTAAATTTSTTVGALTSAAMAFQTNLGEAIGTATVNLAATVTSTVGIPNAGKILITFPSGYDISRANSVTASGLSGVDGTWTATVSGQVLTLTQSGGATSTAGSKSLTIAGIKNPSARANTGTFTVATQTAAGAAVQTGTASAVAVVNISFNSSAPTETVVETTPAPTVVPTPAPVVVAPTPTPVVQPAPIVAAPTRSEIVKNLLSGKFDRALAESVSDSIATDLNLPATSTVAAACTGNTLIKVGGNSAVYYCGFDGRRYVFPNSNVFKTWFGDFKDVKTITPEQMASLILGGNVKYRPGVTMIKLQTDPRVYVVAPGGVLRWVSSEAVAVKLYGAEWNKLVQDISDAFIGNYTMGSAITE